MLALVQAPRKHHSCGVPVCVMSMPIHVACLSDVVYALYMQLFSFKMLPHRSLVLCVSKARPTVTAEAEEHMSEDKYSPTYYFAPSIKCAQSSPIGQSPLERSPHLRRSLRHEEGQAPYGPGSETSSDARAADNARVVKAH